MLKIIRAAGLLLTVLSVAELSAEESGLPPDTAQEPVAQTVESLKRQVIELNRDLFILEEDLLFPASTQLVVYLSLDTGTYVQLDSVKLKIGEEVVATHLYTERQVKALQRGGMQRLYMGNLKTGTHVVTAFMEGIGPEQRPYKIAVSLQVEKDTDAKALEVRIRDERARFEPELTLVEWD